MAFRTNAGRGSNGHGVALFATTAGTGATQLVLTTAPGTGGASPYTVSPTPVVTAKSGAGVTDTSFVGVVTCTLNVLSGSPVLSGTTTKTAVAGVADFSANGLTVTGAGTWTLTFSSGSLSPAVSGTGTTTTSNSAPNQPTISAGTPTSTGVTLTGSAFSDPDVGDTHAASQWQVTTAADTNYLSPVISTGDDATNKTSYAASGLSASTDYIARVRYKDSAGNYSLWSTSASFTTAAGSTVGTPTVLDASTAGTSATTGAQNFSTASVTPSASGVTVVKVAILSQVGTSTPSISGARGTWTLVGSQVNASGNSRVFVWVGTGTATTGQITVTRAGTDTWGPVEWFVEDYPGGHQTTPVRPGSVNSVQKTGSDAFITVPTLLTMASGNALVAAFFISGGVAALTPGSGWTEPAADQTVASSSALESQYRLSTDTQATVTGSISGAQGAGLVFELAHA